MNESAVATPVAVETDRAGTRSLPSLLTFLEGQAFNVIWTLTLAYLLFFGLIPAPHFG